MKKADREYCSDCAYFSDSHGGFTLCNYMIMTGKCRSTICKLGVGCICHSKYEGKQKKHRRNANNKLGAIDTAAALGIPKTEYKRIDKAVARRLYDEGKNDVEIAAAFGVTRASVRFWRTSYGLPANIPPGNPNFKNQGGSGDAG